VILHSRILNLLTVRVLQIITRENYENSHDIR
jgi:hypothetical protein